MSKAAQTHECRSLDDLALVDIKVVRRLAGFTSSTPVYDRVRSGTMPAPIRLSKRCTRWRLGEIRAWLEAQGKEASK
ncbi:helix-turn-helix transcriptional regulator [Caldimonas taiwanensis]|uniref:helix-turn-helix transcriptional regulator n=1 Tax=Caldimonas taiwanensis TaxID=307483 RepID=UPI0007802FB3|nr:AlpA family phage regulatory protein [Caldimonas taiwanensis]